MSQALAARAAAEGSKASLKLANQKRADDRSNRQSADDSERGTGKSLVRDVREMVTSASANDIETSGSASGDMTDINGNPTGEVEDSIQRTQMFLRQRLAARASKTSEEVTPAASRDKNKFITDEQSAAIAAKEAQRIAEMAYRRHGQEQENSENDAGGADMDEDEDGGSRGGGGIEISAPRLSPAKPMNSINGGFSTHGKGGNYSSHSTPSGGRIVYEEDAESASGVSVSLPKIKKGKR